MCTYIYRYNFIVARKSVNLYSPCHCIGIIFPCAIKTHECYRIKSICRRRQNLFMQLHHNLNVSCVDLTCLLCGSYYYQEVSATNPETDNNLDKLLWQWSIIRLQFAPAHPDWSLCFIRSKQYFIDFLFRITYPNCLHFFVFFGFDL